MSRHHREVDRYGDEITWWRKAEIDPNVAARALWLETPPISPGPESSLRMPSIPTVSAANGVEAKDWGLGRSHKGPVRQNLSKTRCSMPSLSQDEVNRRDTTMASVNLLRQWSRCDKFSEDRPRRHSHDVLEDTPLAV